MKGHIRERSPGRWAIVLDVPDSATGKRRRRWHSFTGTKRAAQTECARLIAAMSGATYQEPSTHERYAEICRKNIVPLLGAVPLTKLRPAQISAAWARALSHGHRVHGGALSGRTVHHMHTVFKLALSRAVRWEMLARNPATAIDPPRVERKAMRTFDLAQTAALIEALRGDRLLMPVMLAAMRGRTSGV
jgi:site-specific recombinase XerC